MLPEDLSLLSEVSELKNYLDFEFNHHINYSDVADYLAVIYILHQIDCHSQYKQSRETKTYVVGVYCSLLDLHQNTNQVQLLRDNGASSRLTGSYSSRYAKCK